MKPLLKFLGIINLCISSAIVISMSGLFKVPFQVTQYYGYFSLILCIILLPILIFSLIMLNTKYEEKLIKALKNIEDFGFFKVIYIVIGSIISIVALVYIEFTVTAVLSLMHLAFTIESISKIRKLKVKYKDRLEKD